jgi:hypothetical protein
VQWASALSTCLISAILARGVGDFGQIVRILYFHDGCPALSAVWCPSRSPPHVVIGRCQVLAADSTWQRQHFAGQSPALPVQPEPAITFIYQRILSVVHGNRKDDGLRATGSLVRT